MGFLTSLFGPSKEEIWSQLARDIGGSYEQGGFWGRDAVRYRSGLWEITLDTYTVSSGKSSATYTRMRAPFINTDGLYFHIYRASLFTGLGKLLGMQDIEVGDPFFDEQFVIKGNNEQKLKQLLADDRLKQLIATQPDIGFQIQDDEGWFGTQFPEGVDELRFACYGVLKSEQLLKGLFDMFSLTLERLVQIDSAYPNDPNIRL